MNNNKLPVAHPEWLISDIFLRRAWCGPNWSSPPWLLLLGRIAAIAKRILLLQMEYHGLSVCLSVCMCVCLLVTFMSPAKTAEPTEMPFRGVTGVGPRNHAWGPGPQGKWAILGLSGPLKSIVSHCRMYA